LPSNRRGKKKREMKKEGGRAKGETPLHPHYLLGPKGGRKVREGGSVPGKKKGVGGREKKVDLLLINFFSLL